MKIINILIIIAFSISTIFISLSLFYSSLKTIFGAIGSIALILGGLFTLIKVFITKRAERK